MENRFTFKDLLLLVLLAGIVVLLVLKMVQDDRQWGRLIAIERRLDTVTRDTAEITERLKTGVTVGAPPPGAAPTQPGPAPAATGPHDPAITVGRAGDPFARMRHAQTLPGYARGDWYVDAFGGGVAKITPLLSGDTYGSTVQADVQQSLCDRDPETLEWSGLLATGWKIRDNTAAWQVYVDRRKATPLTEAEVVREPDCPPAGDAKRPAYIDRRLAEGRRLEAIGAEPECPPAVIVSFTLRPGVTFSDGHPLTVDDVVFTFDFIMDPRINAPREKAYYRNIRRVFASGPDEVTFEFAVPYYQYFELAAGIAVMPRHFYGPGAMTPQEFNESVGYLLGSGPYRLEDPKAWKPGKLIQLVRNERYWGVGPAFDKLAYPEITSDVARLTAFRNGETDSFGAFPEQFRELQQDESIRKRTASYAYQSPVGGYRYIAWNQKRSGKATWFADKRVRQAMTLLLDRERMVQEIMLGYAVVATGPFNPQSKQCDAAIQPWPYDPPRAKALLAEAGFKVGPGGALAAPDGQPFRVRLTYPSGNPNYEKMAFYVKDSLARAGVALDPDPQEWSVFTERLARKDFDAITLAWTAGIESDIYQMFHSSQMVEDGDNFMSYRNPELDDLIEQARWTIDEPRRLALWKQCHRILHEDQPYTFLSYPMSLRLLDARIHNVQRIKLGLNAREEWFVPRALQRWTK